MFWFVVGYYYICYRILFSRLLPSVVYNIIIFRLQYSVVPGGNVDVSWSREEVVLIVTTPFIGTIKKICITYDGVHACKKKGQLLCKFSPYVFATMRSVKLFSFKTIVYFFVT